MKLEITRGLLLVGALGVATLAAAAWHEPGPSVISGKGGLDSCPIPPNLRAKQQDVRPDDDLLLFLFGMSQSKAR
ncbi:hypothetical protein ACQCLI_02810 [Pseudomonas nitroreducens]|uniref:hypothetical protein n=1 Tax=Pseudomonas TaxID=286 RepID=UPI0004744EA4|nr:hypothetical protein [Pseudomonas nitroreducens]